MSRESRQNIVARQTCGLETIVTLEKEQTTVTVARYIYYRHEQKPLLAFLLVLLQLCVYDIVVCTYRVYAAWLTSKDINMTYKTAMTE